MKKRKSDRSKFVPREVVCIFVVSLQEGRRGAPRVGLFETYPRTPGRSMPVGLYVYERLVYNTFQTLCILARLTHRRAHCKQLLATLMTRCNIVFSCGQVGGHLFISLIICSNNGWKTEGFLLFVYFQFSFTTWGQLLQVIVSCLDSIFQTS